MIGCSYTGIVPARPYMPRAKAKVENAVQVARRWIVAAVSPRQFLVDDRERTSKIPNRLAMLVREGENKESITQTLMTEFQVPMTHAIINRLDGMMDDLK